MFKKGQGLPLNTVVLAILVILVLVIVIVYFTTSMSETGDSINDNTEAIKGCDVGSYIIPSDDYSDAGYGKGTKTDDSLKCKDGWDRIYSAGKKDETICCAKKK